MTNPISSVTPFPQLSEISPVSGNVSEKSGSVSGASSGPNFQDLLLKTIERVGESDEQTQKLIEEGLVTGDLNQAEIFIAMKKTDMAYRTMIQIRNQALDAYNELQQMRM